MRYREYAIKQRCLITKGVTIILLLTKLVLLSGCIKSSVGEGCMGVRDGEGGGGNAGDEVVESGDRIGVLFIGKYAKTGEVFTKRWGEGAKPIDFVVGSGKMIKGFEEGVLGLLCGDEKDILIKPLFGYGERDKKLFKEIKRNTFRLGGINLEVGDKIRYPDGGGSYGSYPIIKLTDEAVTIDLNHYLAGQKLKFKIKVVKLEKR